MNKVLSIKLTWQGKATIQAIKKFINDAEEIKIVLPDNYNHALFHAFSPDASNELMEELNISGGAELLSKISNVSGLEDIKELINIIELTKAKVQIISPPMLIISCSS